MANPSSVQISILVVDDDPTSLAIVSGFLIKLKHHVVAVKNPLDALDMLRKQSQSFNLILTDVHMPGMSGLQLLQHCEQEFNLPVVLMSADTDKVVMMKGLQDGAAYFLIKPISRDSLDRLWQFAFSWSSKRSTSSSSSQPSSTIDHVPFTPKIITTNINNSNAPNPFMIEYNNNNNNNNANNLVVPLVNNVPSSDQNPRGDNNGIFEFKGTIDGVAIQPRPRRPKMVWTTALHNLFLDAVNKLGVDKAVPKKILEYMNVSGLRRENVASHLQKYRIFLKRMSEVTNSMEQGVPNNWNERPFRSSFVLNEITFLTNNLQLQYSQLLSNPQRKGIANGTSTFEVGESSNQANDQNKTTNNHTLSEKQQPSSTQGTQNGKRKRKYTKQTSKTKKQDCKEGTTQNENPSTNSMVVQNLQGATNNYVGLRINSNGELLGTIKDTNTKGCDNSGDHINVNASLDGNSKKSVAIEIIENSSRSPWNATPNALGVNTNVDVYIPNLVDNAMTSYNLSDDLTQIGIGIHLDENNIFESGFSFGSYDVLGNAPPSIEGVEQGIFGAHDFSLDYSFIQEDELESFLNSYNDQDGDSDLTGFI